MKFPTCHRCENQSEDGWPSREGFTCARCLEKLSFEWWEDARRERELPLDNGPDDYDMAELNRFCFRFAVHALQHEDVINDLRNSSWLLLNPCELMLKVKEDIVTNAPERFSTWEVKGHARMASSGTCRIIGETLPKEVVIQAVIDAGLLSGA